jgi:hypothetical protein
MEYLSATESAVTDRMAWRRSLLASFTLLNACGAGWHRADPSPASPLPPRQQVQIWQGQKNRVLHSVVVSSDTISGVPYQDPADCDSCRVHLARNTVDSMRLGNMGKGALKSMGFAAALMAAAAVVLIQTVDRD